MTHYHTWPIKTSKLCQKSQSIVKKWSIIHLFCVSNGSIVKTTTVRFISSVYPVKFFHLIHFSACLLKIFVSIWFEGKYYKYAWWNKVSVKFYLKTLNQFGGKCYKYAWWKKLVRILLFLVYFMMVSTIKNALNLVML